MAEGDDIKQNIYVNSSRIEMKSYTGVSHDDTSSENNDDGQYTIDRKKSNNDDVVVCNQSSSNNIGTFIFSII